MADEHTIISVCNSDINPENRLNKFEAPLPHNIYFNEQYSIGVSEISFPNLMCNINNADNILALSFYNKVKNIGTNVREINGEEYNLDYHINIPINARYYPSIKVFAETCMNYATDYYNKPEHITEINQVVKDAKDKTHNFNLLSIPLSKFPADGINIKESWLQNRLSRMQQMGDNQISGDMDSKFPYQSYRDLWGDITNYIIDPSGWEVWDKHPYLWSEECYRFWDRLDMESTKFTYQFNNLNTDSHTTTRESHIHKMYVRIKEIFHALKTNTDIHDIRRNLMLSVQFWMCGVFFIDACNGDFKYPAGISDELHLKLADFYTKSRDLSAVAHAYDSYYKTRFFSNNDTTIEYKIVDSEADSYLTIPFFDDILDIMSKLTCSRFEKGAVSANLLSRIIIKGVFHRIALFFEDVRKLFKNVEIFYYEKRVSEKKIQYPLPQ